jgi:hypothetical protein
MAHSDNVKLYYLGLDDAARNRLKTLFENRDKPAPQNGIIGHNGHPWKLLTEKGLVTIGQYIGKAPLYVITIYGCIVMGEVNERTERQ